MENQNDENQQQLILDESLAMFKETIIVEQELIWIKPVCDFFQINYKWQCEVIRKDHILISMDRKTSPHLAFGDKRSRILLPKKGFIRWVQLINPTTVAESLREKFMKYQEMIFDYFYGSAEEEQKVQVSFKRLRKMERIYNKLGNEIKKVKKEIDNHWNQKYLQLSVPFEPKKSIEK